MLPLIWLICLWFYCSYCRYVCNTACVSVSIVKNNIPLTVPRGISPPFRCSAADLNITTAVVDAENTRAVSNQGGRSRALAADFLIQALAEGRGRQGRFEQKHTNSKSAVCAQSAVGSSRFPEDREGGWEALGRWGYKRQTESQDCADSPVWFGPSREPAGLIRT